MLSWNGIKRWQAENRANWLKLTGKDETSSWAKADRALDAALRWAFLLLAAEVVLWAVLHIAGKV